jgi:hypothetical protein
MLVCIYRMYYYILLPTDTLQATASRIFFQGRKHAALS